MRFAMLPKAWPAVVSALEEAGHEQTSLDRAEFLVFNGGAEDFPELPEGLGYVQTAIAGVDGLREAGHLSQRVRWANAAGLYADSVAEGTLGLMLGAAHMYKLVTARASWEVARKIQYESQFLYEDKTVMIVGAGGIGRRLMELLAPFGCEVIAVNKSGRPVAGAAATYPMERLQSEPELWGRADFVVLLAPLTEETQGLMNADVLGHMRDSAFLINAGRGGLVITDDLVAALRAGTIAGAGLDVMEPEPLPDGHPLWELENCLITPHTTNTIPIMKKRLGALAVRNAELFAAGERMETEFDPAAGY
ncbi:MULTISPECIES: D-isomer specific 2-hydroxyacid dehydrogenase family protein [unclassified Corynebacterium]|uniref:D-isomer specific 2-hydroxyacid dehydrogenase family protein n=1 Tax=unclassified Corynebacterium TaxID=2624378 RepID=UPI0029CA6A88|nr:MULTISPECIES: D-isomer specific 2-hydroxyacid dehydrogenase family protein [unclassified Corynebacterium]WPF65599.1 D-isomer specific 2-hydroxyacid dehydrogenase family protein [Corynebacterium sp. 22KM0430]WPF68094.1 D-isomer specific 2-hydroxyacid dehydrogenase family protein [Corynebacterium sp. 21KM1197]